MLADRLIFAITFALAFVTYFFTSAPDLGLVDSGELTTVARTLSIAHPTGYPLYALLGRVWDLLLPLSSARAMVLFSVFWGSVACGLLSVLVFRMLDRGIVMRREWRAAAAVLLALTFAFSPSTWSSVAFAEVYPLTLAIAAALLLIAYLEALDSSRSASLRRALLASYLWGLGFGNHFTILWFFPIILWLAVRGLRAAAEHGRSAAWMATMLAAGLSVNLFLPIRSGVEPPFDWSDPENLQNLLRHLSAWQYRVWMFEGNLAGFMESLAGYAGGVFRDTGWPLLLLAGVGIVRAVMERAWLVLVVFAVWLLGIAYNLNYSIPDISTYFTALYAPLFAVAAFGLISLLRKKDGTETPCRTGLVTGAAALALLLTVVPAYKAANRASDTFARDYSLAVLTALPERAIVFHGNWDIQSPVDYLQTVEGIRADVTMLDLALMQRPWYLKQEARKHPDVFAGSEREIAIFREAVAPFERGQPFNAQRIEDAYVGMINRIIDNHYRARPVYVRDTRNVGHPGVAAAYPSYPGSYFFRIRDERAQEPLLDIESLLRSHDIRDERKGYLMRQVAMAAVMQGTFAADLGDSTRVAQAARQAQRAAPSDPAVQRFLTQVRPFLTDTLSHP